MFLNKDQNVIRKLSHKELYNFALLAHYNMAHLCIIERVNFLVTIIDSDRHAHRQAAARLMEIKRASVNI